MRALKGQHFGYTKKDREEWNKYIAGTVAGVTGTGRNAVVSMISPYDATRELIRKHLTDDCLTPESACDFYLVYVNTPLTFCEARDDKGLYAKARAGEIEHFTGISDPYEVPKAPDLVLPYTETPDKWVARALNLLIYGDDR
jgi:adenylylsulfate kinase-like enzyme